MHEGGFVERLRWLPHIPKPWRRVIRKMLTDDPSARYATTGDVLNAISGLPIDPSWETSVSPNMVRWELAAPKRVKVVEWSLHSERRHEWKAWSQPLDAGRVMTLGQSAGVIGRRQVDRELEAYFG